MAAKSTTTRTRTAKQAAPAKAPARKPRAPKAQTPAPAPAPASRAKYASDDALYAKVLQLRAEGKTWNEVREITGLPKLRGNQFRKRHVTETGKRQDGPYSARSK